MDKKPQDILSPSEQDEYKNLSLNRQSLTDAEHKRFKELLEKMGIKFGGKGRRNLSEKHSTARRRRLSKTRKARNTRRRY